MTQEIIFDRLGRDVVPGAENHQVFNASDNSPVSEGVHFALIAGMKPAMAQDLGSFFRTVPVPGKNIRSANYDLVVLAQLHFNPADGRADAASIDMFRIVHGTDCGGFSQAVNLQNRNSEHHEEKLRLNI